MDRRTEIQNWLAECLAERGHGAKGALAKFMGVRPDAITRILNTDPDKEPREIKARELLLMKEFFGKAPPSMEAELEQARISSGQTVEESASPLEDGFHDGWKPRNAGGIAQLDARAGAGDGAVGEVVVIANGGITTGHLVTDEWVVPRQALGTPPTHVFAIPVAGTSMEPGLKSEDIVFVDRAAAAIKSDEVHLIDDGSGPMVKRIRLEREHEPPRLWIMSDNPSVENYWRPADTIRVIGRVIGKFVRM